MKPFKRLNITLEVFLQKLFKGIIFYTIRRTHGKGEQTSPIKKAGKNSACRRVKSKKKGKGRNRGKGVKKDVKNGKLNRTSGKIGERMATISKKKQRKKNQHQIL